MHARTHAHTILVPYLVFDRCDAAAGRVVEGGVERYDGRGRGRSWYGRRSGSRGQPPIGLPSSKWGGRWRGGGRAEQAEFVAKRWRASAVGSGHRSGGRQQSEHGLLEFGKTLKLLQNIERNGVKGEAGRKRMIDELRENKR